MKARLRAERCPPRAYNRTGWITRTEARMREYISFDSHKHYTLMEREDIQTRATRQRRIEHAPDAIRAALRGCEADTPVAVEATGNWLDHQRDRAGGSAPVAGAPPQGQVDDGSDQQDRQTRRARPESSAAQRHLAHRVDSARRPARSARVNPHPPDAECPAHTLEEPSDSYAGQVRPPAQRVRRRLWARAPVRNCASAWKRC